MPGVFNGERIFFSTNGSRTTQSHHTKQRLDPYLTSHTNINSKCSKDLNVRATVMKFLEENTGVNLHYLGWETVSQMTPKA